jgi:nucleoside-diphosphate-sugar epimerase
MGEGAVPLIETEEQLEDVLSAPSPAVGEAARALPGDVVILGGAGKMGPSLAKLLKRAMTAAGSSGRVVGVARFSSPDVRKDLEAAGVETIACDLLDADAVAQLPDAPDVLFLAGMKFGTTGNQSLTWAMNTYVPAVVARRYRGARIVALSTGNVYPLVPVTSGGAKESDPADPIGEYAQSCLGRERMFQYFSRAHGTPVALIRLNYAIDLRYGVLLDVATKVRRGEPVSLATGYCNVIWQGDANAAVIRALPLCATPPDILNLTGPELVSLRELAKGFGREFGVEPVFTGAESATAFLSNAGRYHRLFGLPSVTLQQMIRWQAGWLRSGGRMLDKPTHFEERGGKY